MEEKKKRVRPTIAQVSEMEETISNQLKELKGWKEEYHALLKSIKGGKEIKTLRDHISALESENSTLKRSNALMEEELRKVQEANVQLGRSNGRLRIDLERLKERGFWARVFNK